MEMHVMEAFYINNTAVEDTVYWSLATRVVLATTIVTIMSVAIVGNLLVISIVLRNRGMRTRTNMFLCNLAIADFLCAFFDMPFSLVTVLCGRWMLHGYDALCRMNAFLMSFCFVASIHTLMYIAIHKYLSISQPFNVVLTESRILLMMAAAWTWAALTSTLTVTGLTSVQYKPFTTQCGPKFPDDPKSYAHLMLVLLTCYAAPLGVIIFCYSGLFRHIRLLSERLELNTTIDKRAICAQQRRILFTLVLVLMAFIVCCTPWVLYSLYVTAIGDETQAASLMNPITYWFAYLNSACNPIIYALRSDAFRQGYVDALCWNRWKKHSDSSGEARLTQYSSERQFPWRNQCHLPSRKKSLVTDANDRRLSTYSLPANVTSDLTGELDNAPGQLILRGNVLKEDSVTYPGQERSLKGSPEAEANKELHSQSVNGVFHSHPLPLATQWGNDTFSLEVNSVSGVCLLPRYRAIDWRVVGKCGIRGGKAKGRSDPTKRGDNQSTVASSEHREKIIFDSTAETLETGEAETETQNQNPISAEASANQSTVTSGSSRTRIAEAIETQSTVNRWHKRISQKWKRHSHKNPSSRQTPTTSKPARRSRTLNKTFRPTLQRCPSVERLDRVIEPYQRQRTATDIPQGYRRRKLEITKCPTGRATPEGASHLSKEEKLQVPQITREEKEQMLGAILPILFTNDNRHVISKKGGGELKRTLSAPCCLGNGRIVQIGAGKGRQILHQLC